MSAPQLNAIVLLVNRISPLLMVLQVVPDGWTMPEFKLGQYVAIDYARSPPIWQCAPTAT